jgi:hypothetical protein
VACDSCESNRKDFPAEIAMHFKGLENVDKPAVLVFADVSTCLKCGDARLVIPEKELRELAR